MIDRNFRKSINEFVKFNEDDPIIFLENPSFDKSIVGITENNKLIYDYSSMIEEYMEDEKCSYEDAEEFIQYNTLRAIPYFPNPPVIMMLSKKEIKKLY